MVGIVLAAMRHFSSDSKVREQNAAWATSEAIQSVQDAEMQISNEKFQSV